MTHFDVFNGDADGLCALHQLRLAAPLESDLVSGPKRDIGLLARESVRPLQALAQVRGRWNRTELVRKRLRHRLLLPAVETAPAPPAAPESPAGRTRTRPGGRTPLTFAAV